MLIYLDVLTGENPLEAPPTREGETTPPNEQLDYFRRRLRLPAERVKITLEFMQIAGFSGEYSAQCRGKLAELQAVLENGASLAPPEQAETILQEAQRLGKGIRADATPLIGGHIEAEAAPPGPFTEGPVVFRILLLSDIHCGMPGYKPLWPVVESGFIHDLSTVFGEPGRFDLVIFCGDMVYSADDAEFGEFNRVLGKIWEKLMKLPSMSKNPPFVSVPGNHDVAWLGPAFRGRLETILASDSNHFLKDLFGDEQNDTKTVVHEALARYRDWKGANLHHQRQEGKESLVENYSESPLGDFSMTLSRDGRRLGVVGLCSASRQLSKEKYKGRLALDCRQLNSVCKDHPPDWAKNHDACLLVTHHPVAWLDDESKRYLSTEGYRAGAFFLHIHGHAHEPNLTHWSEHGLQPLPNLQVPSLFGLERYIGNDATAKTERIHGYSVLEVAFKGPACFRYRTRVRAKTAKWIDPHDFDANIQSDGWSKTGYIPSGAKR